MGEWLYRDCPTWIHSLNGVTVDTARIVKNFAILFKDLMCKNGLFLEASEIGDYWRKLNITPIFEQNLVQNESANIFGCHAQ